jgi:uncharacterized protein
MGFQEEMGAALTDRALHLIVLPTEQCNFRCTYCYEDFTVGHMQPTTVQGIKRLLDRRMAGLERLNVSWFGGEPLMARAVVEEISAHIVTAAADAPTLQYMSDMTTNGYLLGAPVAERLAELGVRSYQISLDGPEAVHDTTRVRANGGSSYRQIWQNLLALRDSALPIGVILRCHLTPANLPSMPDFLAEVRDTFLDDDRFSVSLKPVERMGGPNDGTMDVLSKEARTDVMAELEAVLSAGVSTVRNAMGAEVCYASRPNSLVIRADGRIGKCTVALTDPANTVGQLLPDGRLRIDNTRMSPWFRGWADQDWNAVRCPYVGMPRTGSEPPLLQIGRHR